MVDNEPGLETAAAYRRFAAQEARGRSPLYEEFAAGVAQDRELLGFLDGLPRAKRQPNLLFAAVRYVAGVQPDYRAFRVTVLERRDEVAATMLARRTQTNEPARCATLLPALAALPQPLALLEVGASAGLCLLPDRYSYVYEGVDLHRRLDGAPGAPVLTCQVRGPTPLPAALPRVVWRTGIDLNPLDVADADDVRWLSCLVWPGESGRAERLTAAVQLARRDPPRLVRGDLIERLAPTAVDAPSGATLVVFHSAVLAYLDPGRLAEFADTVTGVAAVWLSNEAPEVLSWPLDSLRGVPAADERPSPFVLTRDGREALALTDPHGNWVHWLE